MDPRLSELPSSRSSRRSGGEDSVEARRYLDALRRRLWLILLLGAAAALGALVVSSWAPDRYKATASIVKQVTVGPYETVNVDALTRELSTIKQLLLASDVLGRAAEQRPRREPRLGPGRARGERRSRRQPRLRHGHGRRAQAGGQHRQRGRHDVHRDAARRRAPPVRAGARGPGPGAQARPGPAGRVAAGAGHPAAPQRARCVPRGRRHGPPDRRARRRRPTSAARRSRCATRSSRSSSGCSSASCSRLRATSSSHASPGRASSAGSWTCRCSASVPYVRKRLAGGRRPLTGKEYESYQTLGTSVRFALPPESGPQVLRHHERPARRGQEHGRRAARAHARPGRPPDAARLRRPALADAARAARYALRAGPRGAARRGRGVAAPGPEPRAPRQRLDRRGGVGQPLRRARRPAQRPQARRPGEAADRRGSREALRRHRGARLRVRDRRRAAAARHRRHAGARSLRATASSTSRDSTASRSTT